jgi:peptidoglycan/LPS O-acetylase OafA/YrhL
MDNLSPATGLLNTKQHYQVLDGLRGIAAITVVVFHFWEIAVPDPSNNFIVHAYLAVDFFFCLSGFVIAYAYDSKLKAIGLKTFFKLRLIRLHPLVLIGSVVGIISFIFDPFSDLWMKYSDNLLIMFIASCLMIPYAMVRERYFNIFHLNAPSWSLFWEYIANLIYGLILIRVGKKVLWVLAVIGALWLFREARLSTNLGVGWSGDNFWGGGVRAFYPFVAGILIYRMNFIIPSRLGFLATGALLMLAFLFPFINDYNWIIEPLIVIFYFPLLVAVGAGTVAGARAEKICEFAGHISYPLYMIHYPFIWIFFSYVETYKPAISEMAIIAAVGTILLTALAYVVLMKIDIPIRKWLKDKWITNPN